MKAYLALEDGTIFEGNSVGAKGEVIGEIVFNTGTSSYQEVLVDPSYYGLIVTMTYPLIGNYGINTEDIQDVTPKVKGLVVRELCSKPSNWRSTETLGHYLERNSIVAIEGIDTRALTRVVRENGSMRAIISTRDDFDFENKKQDILNHGIVNPVEKVTTDEIKRFPGTGHRVALIDYGTNPNIIKSLLRRNCEVIVFPSKTPSRQILDEKPDGILLSNGPGNPKECIQEIQTVKELLGKKPIFGICLGHLILALASGGDTTKLKYGHRGSNHPVKDLQKNITYITTQNHGYTVTEDSITGLSAEISHKNMNDGSIEGLIYQEIPAFSVQFHPEAAPGPTETAHLYDKFIDIMG